VDGGGGGGGWEGGREGGEKLEKQEAALLHCVEGERRGGAPGAGGSGEEEGNAGSLDVLLLTAVESSLPVAVVLWVGAVE